MLRHPRHRRVGVRASTPFPRPPGAAIIAKSDLCFCICSRIGRLCGRTPSATGPPASEPQVRVSVRSATAAGRDCTATRSSVDERRSVAGHLLDRTHDNGGSRKLTSDIEQSLISCPFQGAAVQVAVVGQRYVADFTGHLTVGLDPSQLSQYLRGASNGVELLIQEYVANGVGAVIGAISMTLDPDRDPGPSRLTPITPGNPFPAVQDFVVNMHVEIPTLLPGIRLRNVVPPNPGPTILRNANVTAFPPQNDVYQLVEPMDLEDINNPGPVLATIQYFPLTVNPPSA